MAESWLTDNEALESISNTRSTRCWTKIQKLALAEAYSQRQECELETTPGQIWEPQTDMTGPQVARVTTLEEGLLFRMLVFSREQLHPLKIHEMLRHCHIPEFLKLPWSSIR